MADGWQNVLLIGGEKYHWSSDIAKMPSLADHAQGLEDRLNDMQQPMPCVVVPGGNEGTLSDASLHSLLLQWLLSDDVLTVDFVKTVVLVEQSSNPSNMSMCSTQEGLQSNRQLMDNWPLLGELGTEQVFILQVENSSKSINPGPYLINGYMFHSIFRVYEDTQSAFFSSIHRDFAHGSGPFVEERPTAHIKVPSRVSGQETAQKAPLKGLRFGLKDVFDVEGLRTSNGCRAWHSFYDPRAKTAESIQMLLAAGAELVGKTKNTQFANGEDPQEWIDYSCPWNPRGDGYQNPDTSSSGSAAAVAAYEWLDFAVGSDTCGSIACPASSQGLFAIRYSTGALPSTGVFKINKRLDSMGIMTRSIDVLYDVSKVWGLGKQYETKEIKSHMPSKILYPWSVSPHGNPDVMKAMDTVFAELETFTGVKMKKIDIEDEWVKANLSNEKVALRTWMQNTTAHLHITGFDQATRPFREEYQAKLGKKPYLDRVNNWKAELSNQVTDEDKKIMVERQDIFTDWFRTAILDFKAENPINTILVWPFSPDYAIYRDNYPPLTPHVNFKWDIDFSPPLAGLPHIIVPVGQFPYESRITGATEYLPICVAVVSSAGSDLVLLEFLKRFLHKSKLETTVKTGTLAFNV